MNLRQLELFVSIVETGSFSRCAEAAAVTQSTVSQHVAALEAEVGMRLLDRTGRGVQATRAGELFLKHARRVLAERDALVQTMAGFGGLKQSSLIVGASNIPANYLIPSLLPRLTDEHPGIELTLRTGDSREVRASLLADEVELAVVGSCGNERGLDYHPLADDLLVLTVSADHPLSRRTSLNLAELMETALIVRESGSGSDQALRLALRQVDCDPEQLQVAVKLGSNEAVRQTLLGGYGAAFLSEISIRQELQRGELVTIPVEGLTVARQFWLTTRARRTLSPAAQLFAGLLLETFSASAPLERLAARAADTDSHH